MKVAAVIPAYNEEPTVAAVAHAALRTECVDEVIVVDNASTDNTAAAAAATGATVLHCAKQGKGEAMLRGVRATDAEVIVFLDADLLGLTTNHIEQLVEPVTSGRAGMSLGLFDRGPELNPLFMKALPRLTGQRALRREVFEGLDPEDIKGYKVEAALNSHAQDQDVPIEAFVCKELWHRTKEEKATDGALYGTARKVRMLATAVWSYASYQLVRPVRRRVRKLAERR